MQAIMILYRIGIKIFRGIFASRLVQYNEPNQWEEVQINYNKVEWLNGRMY